MTEHPHAGLEIILLTDVPRYCAFYEIGWNELKDAVRLETIKGHRDADGKLYLLVDDLEAWRTKRELQRKWMM